MKNLIILFRAIFGGSQADREAEITELYSRLGKQRFEMTTDYLLRTEGKK